MVYSGKRFYTPWLSTDGTLLVKNISVFSA